MKYLQCNYVAIGVLTLLLTACGGGGGGGDGGGGGGGDSAAKTNLKNIAGAAVTAEPTDITDVAAVQKDLTAVFGAADGEPVEVSASDTALTVISRTGR